MCLTFAWEAFRIWHLLPAFSSNLLIFAPVIFSSSLSLLFAAAVSVCISTEEPPPRPPQPAGLIKSKSGLSQQLLTHCSCPLCSLLAPLLKGTSHSCCLSSAWVCSEFLVCFYFFPHISSSSTRPCVPLTAVQCLAVPAVSQALLECVLWSEVNLENFSVFLKLFSKLIKVLFVLCLQSLATIS